MDRPRLYDKRGHFNGPGDGDACVDAATPPAMPTG